MNNDHCKLANVSAVCSKGKQLLIRAKIAKAGQNFNQIDENRNMRA